MKVRVNFTVEFDADEFREAYSLAGEPLSNSQIRNMVQNNALSYVQMSMGDDGIETEGMHNN